jgi:hypothetical protein
MILAALEYISRMHGIHLDVANDQVWWSALDGADFSYTQRWGDRTWTVTAKEGRFTASIGETATFGVIATGKAPLVYQWRKNSSDISGAIAASYTTPVLTSGDANALFSVVVSNTAGSANPQPAAALLTLVSKPVISSSSAMMWNALRPLCKTRRRAWPSAST